MAKILIKNGRVIDPANGMDEAADILVEGAKISKVANGLRAASDQIIDAAGKIVIPGLVDMHVHLREPGREDKETVASGTMAGLKGGVTSLLAMPNTDPAIDSPENARLLKAIIKNSALSNVLIAAAITRGREGKELVDIAKLKSEGALAITDDGTSVDDEELLLKAMKLAKAQGILVICHSEDKTLSGKGVVNRGLTATRLGLRGISSESEYKCVERDILLAKKSGCRVHIAHVSCKESVKLIARAKKEGLDISAETAPHYFTFSEEALMGYDTNFKMNPPLRSKADIEAIKQGLADGTIEMIASDHAPHTENEKDIEFDRAEFGVAGLETELASGITELIGKKVLNWPQLVEKLCLNPAKRLGLDKPPHQLGKEQSHPTNWCGGKGTLGIGSDADIVVLAPDEEWLVTKEGLISKSKNCAFLGKKLRAVVKYTLCKGKVYAWNS